MAKDSSPEELKGRFDAFSQMASSVATTCEEVGQMACCNVCAYIQACKTIRKADWDRLEQCPLCGQNLHLSEDVDDCPLTVTAGELKLAEVKICDECLRSVKKDLEENKLREKFEEVLKRIPLRGQ